MIKNIYTHNYFNQYIVYYFKCYNALSYMFKSVYFLQVLFSAFLVLIILGFGFLIADNMFEDQELFNNLANFVIIR